MATPSTEDIAAMRAQGDFGEYLRSLIGTQPETSPTQKAAAAVDYGPTHRRGAWPAGTRPAGPNICDPGCGCALNDPPTIGGTL